MPVGDLGVCLLDGFRICLVLALPVHLAEYPTLYGVKCADAVISTATASTPPPSTVSNRGVIKEAVTGRNRRYIVWSVPCRCSALVLETVTRAANDQALTSGNSRVCG